MCPSITPHLLPAPHPNMQHLTFSLIVHDQCNRERMMNYLRHLDWKPLQKVLPHCRSLKIITFDYSRKTPLSEQRAQWEESVREQLSCIPATVCLTIKYNLPKMKEIEERILLLIRSLTILLKPPSFLIRQFQVRCLVLKPFPAFFVLKGPELLDNLLT